MRRGFLAEHPLIGTKHKPAALPAMERSPYYWWWQYLRRNRDYLACCEAGGKGRLAKLHADFGDVRSDDFRAWWGGSQQKGELLFAEQPAPLHVEKLNSKADWLDTWDANDVLVVAVNLRHGRRHTQRRFAKLLEKEHKGRRGRISLAKAASTAKYPLYRNFSVHNLKVMLRAYDVWAENQALPRNQRKTLWQLGEAARVQPAAITRASDTKYERTEKRNVMSVTMSRYIINAKRIIANTAKGQFPNSAA